MSVYQRLVNLDQVFNQLATPPIIINDLATNTEEEKEELNKKIYTLYDSGVMEPVAHCECGKLSGEFNLGVICKSCNTAVSSALYQDLEPILWVRAPEGVTSLFNPHVWHILNKAFSISNFSIIRWICETTYNQPREFKEIKTLQSLGIQRGYNYFVQNFENIIQKLAGLKAFTKPGKREYVNQVLDVLEQYRDCIFCKYIPLPNRVLLVIEDTNVGRYVDSVYFGLIDAIQMIASVDTVRAKPKKDKPPAKISVTEIFKDNPEESVEFINLTQDQVIASPDFLDEPSNVRKKENKTVRMLHAISLFNNNYYRVNLGSKTGLIRKHVLSSRANFSCRAVITSITTPHEYDELYVPWTSAIGALRYHILNKLIRRGFLANQAVSFLNSYSRVYHPLLDKIFEELINESIFEDPETGEILRGIPVTMCRNPSLGRGSILRLRVTHVRKDPNIWTFGLSILAVVSLNA